MKWAILTNTSKSQILKKKKRIEPNLRIVGDFLYEFFERYLYVYLSVCACLHICKYEPIMSSSCECCVFTFCTIMQNHLNNEPILKKDLSKMYDSLNCDNSNQCNVCIFFFFVFFLSIHFSTMSHPCNFSTGYQQSNNMMIFKSTERTKDL